MGWGEDSMTGEGLKGPKISQEVSKTAREAIPGASGLPKAARGSRSTKKGNSSPTCPLTEVHSNGIYGVLGISRKDSQR